MAAAVTISVYKNAEGLSKRMKSRQWRSVQSIIGAIDTLELVEYSTISLLFTYYSDTYVVLFSTHSVFNVVHFVPNIAYDAP